MDADAGGDEREIEALIHPGEDGKFWAEVVGLPGCYAQGDNYSKILANLRDAHALCSAAASGTPPPVPISLAEGATAADLSAALAAHGWGPSSESSASHTLLVHPASGAHLCVPLDPGAALNSGFRQALAKFLGAGE